MGANLCTIPVKSQILWSSTTASHSAGLSMTKRPDSRKAFKQLSNSSCAESCLGQCRNTSCSLRLKCPPFHLLTYRANKLSSGRQHQHCADRVRYCSMRIHSTSTCQTHMSSHLCKCVLNILNKFWQEVVT